MAIKLGDKVRDTVTGLEGIAVARTEWLLGCIRWGVQPVELKDGKPVEDSWFDEARLQRVTDAKVKNRLTGGGPSRETDSARRRGDR